MKYFLYKTVNKINDKFYIGVHQTEDINDGYLGSSLHLDRAINKYGKENFKREIIAYYSSEKEMLKAEENLVTPAFIKENKDKIYNLNGGGEGSWVYNNHINPKRHERRKNAADRLKELLKIEEWKNNFCNKISIGNKKAWEEGRNKGFTGKKLSEEHKRSIGEAAKKLTGEKNHCFGCKWMSNDNLKQSKLIKKDKIEEYLKNGWIIGHKFNAGCFGKKSSLKNGGVA